MKASASKLLVLGAFLAFSLMPIFTREAGAPVLGIVAWRAIVVALVFGVWTVISEGGLPALRASRATLRIGALYGVALAVASSTFVGGYALTTVANTVFLHNLAPAVAFPLAWWAFRERPAGDAVIGAVLATLGVGLLSGVSIFQFAQFTNPRFLVGDLSALMSAVGYAAVLVLTRRARVLGTPLLGTLFVAWSVAAALLTTVALVFDTMALPLDAIPWVVGLAVVCTNIPFFLLSLGMRSLKAGLTSVLSMSEVVFTTLLGMLVYGEGLAPVGWLGAAFVVFGLLYPLMGSAAEPAPVAAPATPPNADPSSAPGGSSRGLTADASASRAVLGDDGAAAPRDAAGAPPASPPPRPAPKPPPPMSPDSSPWRGLRLALYLVLFNAGAVVALLAGDAGGALLAWVGLLGLLRLGMRPGLILLEGRFSGALRWGTFLVAGGAVVGVLGGLSAGASGSLLFAALAAGALWADVALARREAPTDRDTMPWVRAAILVAAVAQIPAMAGHPAGGWLWSVAVVCAALVGGTIVVATLVGAAPHEAVHQALGVSTLDGPVRGLSHPMVLGGASVVLFLAGGVHIVPTSHQAIVERFGVPVDAPAPAGLLLRLPPPIERVLLVDVGTIREGAVVDVRSTLLCGDQSMVSIEASVQWHVADAEAFANGFAAPDAALTELARAALVEALAHRAVDEVLTTGRAALEAEVASGARQAARSAGLGIEIEAVHVSVAAVPPNVSDAFLDVISAEEEKRTSVNLAQAYAADVLPRVRGQALARLDAAQGEGERLGARSEAELAFFHALASGGVTAPELTRFRLAHERASAVLGPARPYWVSPALHPWVGDHPADPKKLRAGVAGSKKER
jgi:modulator of FtsH protease HflK